MPYKFIKTPDPDNQEFSFERIVMKAPDDVGLPELFECFQRFALACGYHPKNVAELNADYVPPSEVKDEEQE